MLLQNKILAGKCLCLMTLKKFQMRDIEKFIKTCIHFGVQEVVLTRELEKDDIRWLLQCS